MGAQDSSIMTLTDPQKKSPINTVLLALIVVVIAGVLIVPRLLFPIYRVKIDSRDPTITSDKALVFPVFVDSSGNIRLLTGYMTLPSGGGQQAAVDPINNPWPIVPAPLTFRWNPLAEKVGWVVRRERPEIWKPDDRDVRVFWMTPEELLHAVDVGEVILPEFDRMERFDLSQLSR